MPTPNSVDVAVSVYGKPYITAVTLLSLLKQSGQWIDTIYFIEERQQPEGTSLAFLKRLLKPYNVVYYRPWMNYGYRNMLTDKRRYLLPIPLFRRSVRYQYAWEKTDKAHLFITHNDVLYTDDLVKAYLDHIGDGLGIGKVGQCWNCPAYKEGLCNGDRYTHYRPDVAEVESLYAKHGDPRGGGYKRQLAAQGAWPLPECRLNEYACLIDMTKARSITQPEGAARPFGFFGNIDTASEWFKDINHMGYTVTNFDYDPYASHSWVNAINNGHRALSDRSIYEAEEAIARQYLQTEFGLTAAQLA
ncbi:hypothetical protein J2I47_19655 [Fibrella sp. HMF5335]|uniref:Uncharacterized protein n=1 Tax=Fibrella rubiginis TaxID=2817060 RepID=A0A939GLT7_9BACT|nr:hypothetical protein [Fibrella rubiginis]MBO0938777.1 hypothetical protein [Fibrella rubiginis]